MLDKLIDFSLRNRLLVLLLLTASFAVSPLLLGRLNLDAFPDVTTVQVQINTEANGLAAEEVEQLITYPIESLLYALPQVAQVRSISKTGLSSVSVVFDDDTDIYFARQQVFEQLQRAKGEIPSGLGTPLMGPNSSGLGQVFQYILRAAPDSGFDAMGLRSLNDWLVKRLLMPVPGITELLTFGGQVRQYQVRLDPQKLLGYGITQAEVSAAIEANNLNAGGWYLDRGQEQLVIRGVGWLAPGEQGLEQIRQTPLRQLNGQTIKVSDLAEVGFGAEIRQGAVTMTRRNTEGKVESLGEVVAGIVQKRRGANTKATIDGVKARLPLIQAALPRGVTIEPVYDQSELVEQAVATVSNALLIAFGLIVAVLLLFLLNLRASLLVLLSIPLSLLLALMLMAQWGLSANLMSLGGLAIAIGMLVDGSVVVVEQIVNRLQQNNASELRETIRTATLEVGRSVFFAGAIIIIVFAPLFALEGIEGKLFQPMAVAIILAMCASLLAALWVVPALASYLFRRPPRQRHNPFVAALEAVYRPLLKLALKVRWLALLAVALMLSAALLLLPRLGSEFVPELEEGTLNVRVTFAPSVNLDTVLATMPKLEQQLLQLPEVRYATSYIGRAELGDEPEPISNVEIYVGLTPPSEWSSADSREELQELMAEKLALHPGLLFGFSQPIAARVDELISGAKAPLAIKLFGPDLSELARLGHQIEQLVRTTPGADDVELEPISGEAQLVIRPRREALASYGLTVAELMSLVSDAIGGQNAGQILHGNERYDIVTRLAKSQRESVEAIRQLRLATPGGAWIRLQELAQVEIESGPPQIRRDEVQRRVVIQAEAEGRDLGGLVAELKQRIESEIQLPSGYSVLFGGQYQSQQRAEARLQIVVPISLGLIFLLLYFAFHSVTQALLIMLNLPLALIGGIAALYLSHQYLSVPSAIGFIALFGIAVLNGVVLVNAINQRLATGSALQEAIFEGALSRLRPVLMTAITTALGLLPMLLSSGVGAEIQQPLATVVLGGLISSTLLTLFILPVAYSIFNRDQQV